MIDGSPGINPKSNPRLISLAHLTVLDADPVALIDAGVAGGFDAVGLRVVAPLPGDRIIPVVGDRDLQRRIKQRLSETGLRILDIEAVWLQPDTVVEALCPALEIGAELGAKYVLTVGFDADANRLSDNFGAFCAAAHQCGLRTMLEFIPYATIASLKQAHDFLRATAPADAGLLVDALHLSRSGGHPRDLAQYDASLFSYMHLCDAVAAIPPADRIRPEARGDRFLPGDGELWLAEFVAAFPPGTPAGVEAPVGKLAALPVLERARRAGDATRRFLGKL
jgi:sugar phosphate isomerase/epimerase